jgi:protoporphyrinogen oxidase
MMIVKYLILGGGPSGLSFAHTLKRHGEKNFLILEQESVAGGLCRSANVDGAPLDIGGGHFLDVKRKEVLELLFQFMPREEWQEYTRVSKIKIRGFEIDHPLEGNLWQLPVEDQIDFLESIARTGCVRGEPPPESFEAWITWKLGERIAREYMLPYNRKIWSIELSKLGIYWLHKLPAVSFRETLKSCLEGKPMGTLPAHGTFLYPRQYGYGEVWKRMGEDLGSQLIVNTPVTSIDLDHHNVNGTFKAETIVNTIPWPVWDRVARIPETIRSEIAMLRHTSLDVDYHPEDLGTRSHWIYEPDESITYHRILCRSNFCPKSRGHWTESNSTRSSDSGSWRHRNEYAYPVSTLEKPKAIATITNWAEKNGILCLGRWGTWEHMNSDVATSLAIAAAQNVLGIRYATK